MSEPTLQQEIEARRPATEGTLQQIASVYIDSVADIAGIKTAIESLNNKELATELTLAQILTTLGGTAADIGTLKLENGQIKIDTGKIAGDLKLVKDNQGRLYGKYGEAWIPVKVDSEGRPIISQGPAGTEPWPVQLSGTSMELYGATIDERPPANSVPVGATYMAVNTQDVWQSNGTDWVVM